MHKVLKKFLPWTTLRRKFGIFDKKYCVAYCKSAEITLKESTRSQNNKTSPVEVFQGLYKSRVMTI